MPKAPNRSAAPNSEKSGSLLVLESQTGTFRVHFKNEKGWENVYMHVWADPNNPLTNWPGIQMTKDSDGSYYYDLSVTGTGIYNYVFNDGKGSELNVNKTKDITNVHYAPDKAVWFDYDTVTQNTADTAPTETGGVARGSNSDGSYSLEIEGDAFTNTMTTPLDLQIVKTDSVDGRLLEKATFTLTNAETGVQVGAATTEVNGIATFPGIQRGATYELRETGAPSGYMTAGPWILKVEADGNAKYYPATEKADKTLEKTSDTDTGTTLTVTDGSDSKVLELPIQDTPWGYELPDTGGAGTTSYTAGGLALIFGAATLMYIHCKRRKEDEASS